MPNACPRTLTARPPPDDWAIRAGFGNGGKVSKACLYTRKICLLWHKTNKPSSDGGSIWVLVDKDGTRIKNDKGLYTTRYNAIAGVAYYTTKRATVDKSCQPEEMPDGWPADSREGIISRFCFTPEAQRDWAFLDAWKRRRTTAIAHLGCGDGQWPIIPPSLPLTCPHCGPLNGDDTLYAQWYTLKDPEGESILACVYEAWLTGKRFDYLKGKRPTPASKGPSNKKPVARTPIGDPAPSLDEPLTPETSRAPPVFLLVGAALLGMVMLASVAYVATL